MPYAVAAGISVAGGIGSALISSDASKSAANQQAESAREALALQERQFATTQGNVQPYINSGQNALLDLNKLLGLDQGGAGPVAANPILQMLGIGGPGPMGSIDPSKFTGSPGYQYQVQQGLDSVRNQATTGPGGGNALLALQKTGQGMANQNWGNYLSNASSAWQQMLGNVGAGASTGLNAASALAGDSQNFANAAGGDITGAGNARAAGTMGSANAIAGGINGGVNNFNNLITNPDFMKAMSAYFNNNANTSALQPIDQSVNTFNAGNPFSDYQAPA